MRERQKRACADCEWNHGDRVLCSLAPMQMEELHAFPFRKGLVVGPQYPNGGGRLALSLHKPRLPNRMVVSSDGRECVFTFGSADHGLGGNGGNKYEWHNNPAPGLVKALSAEDFVDLASGPNTVVCVTKKGTIRVWGSAMYGNAVPGSAPPALNLPGTVNPPRLSHNDETPPKFVHATSTYCRTVALAADGEVYQWGGREVYWDTMNMTELMRGTTETSNRIERVPSLCQRRVVQLSAGYSHVLALNAGGTVYSWGEGNYGKLGHNDEVTLLIPKRIKEFKWLNVRVTHISAGDDHNVAVGCMGDERVVLSWGKWDERLGLGSEYPKTQVAPVLPVQPRQRRWQRLTYQELFVVAKERGLELKQNKKVLLEHIMEYEWEKFRLAKEKAIFAAKIKSTPRQKYPLIIPALRGSTVFQAQCGDSHCAVLTEEGTVMVWGHNSHCQLGLGDTNPRALPIKIRQLRNVSYVAMGARHTLAVTRKGELLSWGDNQYGQCGHGDFLQRSVPRIVHHLWGYAVNHAACGTRHSVVIANRPRCTLKGTMVNNKSMRWHHPEEKVTCGTFTCGRKATSFLAPPTFNYKVKAIQAWQSKTLRPQVASNQESRLTRQSRPPDWLQLTYEADLDDAHGERAMNDRKLWTLGYHDFVYMEGNVRSAANIPSQTFQEVDERNYRLRDAYFRRRRAVRAVVIIQKLFKYVLWKKKMSRMLRQLGLAKRERLQAKEKAATAAERQRVEAERIAQERADAIPHLVGRLARSKAKLQQAFEDMRRITPVAEKEWNRPDWSDAAWAAMEKTEQAQFEISFSGKPLQTCKDIVETFESNVTSTVDGVVQHALRLYRLQRRQKRL